MTQNDAKRAVLEEWHSWIVAMSISNANGRDGLRFFAFLQKERDHLLRFKASGDKWQVIHGWLLRANITVSFLI
jgi:hypothetical protein